MFACWCFLGVKIEADFQCGPDMILTSGPFYMERPNAQQSSLAVRLAMEFRVLQVILERRAETKQPKLGKGVERRIIQRNLEELAQLAHADSA
jgi:hypothetical protein